MGGTLLGTGVEVQVKSARWEMDTGAYRYYGDSTVFSGEAEVRGFNAHSGFRVSYSTHRMKTQGLNPILEAPPSFDGCDSLRIGKLVAHNHENEGQKQTAAK